MLCAWNVRHLLFLEGQFYHLEEIHEKGQCVIINSVEEVLEVDGDIDHARFGGALRYVLWTWEVDTV